MIGEYISSEIDVIKKERQDESNWKINEEDNSLIKIKLKEDKEEKDNGIY
jgi:hypothetical protein